MRASEFLTEAKQIATLRIGNLRILVDEHAIEQVYFREIKPSEVDTVLRKLPNIQDRLEQMHASAKVWVTDPTTGVSIGLRRNNDTTLDFQLKTAVQNRTYDSHTPEITLEQVLDEMPLPADWDPSQFRQQGTSFKSRLAYALERAKRLGAGSSRVATTIEYQGRPTVLKIAKNAKGLAQNSVEADILSDGYASQIGIMIPIIDYDEQNREPSWIHTEMATKANEQQLCHLMKCDSLMQLIRFANTIAGKYRGQTAQSFIERMVNDGKLERDIDIMTEYANKLADLANSFDVELADFGRPANWGIYQGQPVVIDVGFNSNVLNQYYR